MLHGKIYRKQKKRKKKEKKEDQINSIYFYPRQIKKRNPENRQLVNGKNGKNENTKREKEKEICRLSENRDHGKFQSKFFVQNNRKSTKMNMS